jgi:hypothetical protein
MRMPRVRRAALAALASLSLAIAAAGGPDWPAWFAKNTTVTDKKAYVHFFWNANEVRARFDGREREALVAEAARQLVARQFPAKSTADTFKVDVVFVAERDGYGMPKWDTLQRVAHVEGSRRKILAVPLSAPPAELRKAFDRFELF